MIQPEVRSVESYLNDIDYSKYNTNYYVPTTFALEFVNFIKLVNGGAGEENETPILHYKMLDKLVGNNNNICNLLFRGSAKTTLFGEYLFLYLATFGKIPEFGDISLALYISDSIENGVKNMRKNLQYRWENSDFLREFVPTTRFTDIRWEFTNVNGKKLIVKGYGGQTGVRGSKELGTRPNFALLDDLISDEDARSPTVISAVEDTVYKAIEYALHPRNSKIVWNGTPFNAKDPLYKAVESGAWHVNVYPVCNDFPCEKKDFKGAWEDRFPYEYVKDKYNKALLTGKIDAFNQELMLRIMSDEDRLVTASDIGWYSRKHVLDNMGMYNFYITTDFATSEKRRNDFSVIFVWAVNSNGDYLWVDGVVKRQLMDKNINMLFEYAQLYKPQQVGIEISGQQKGFISWIQNEMMTRNIYFNLASDNNSQTPGIHPNTSKLERFNVVVPWFKAGKIKFPIEKKESFELKETISELSLISVGGIKSKHDDCIDNISMLPRLTVWKPSASNADMRYNAQNDMWEIEPPEEELNKLDSYIV
jgi:phage terminase large subunit-like protein